MLRSSWTNLLERWLLCISLKRRFRYSSPPTSHLSPPTSHLSPLTSPLSSLPSPLSPLPSLLSPLPSHLSPLFRHPPTLTPNRQLRLFQASEHKNSFIQTRKAQEELAESEKSALAERISKLGNSNARLEEMMERARLRLDQQVTAEKGLEHQLSQVEKKRKEKKRKEEKRRKNGGRREKGREKKRG